MENVITWFKAIKKKKKKKKNSYSFLLVKLLQLFFEQSLKTVLKNLPNSKPP